MNLNNYGIVVKEPSKCLLHLPFIEEVSSIKEPSPKWYDKILNSIFWFWDTEFMFCIKVAFARGLQISAFILAYYFMQGGKL